MITSLLVLAAMLNSEIKGLVENTQIATLSTDYEGTPFGSLVPYILDKQGRPVVFLSKMALHSKNLSKNAKCSIMISRINNKNPFNSSRITFVGTMYHVPDDEVEALKKAYLAKYHMANDFIDFDDFSFSKLMIDKIYWVGGFGDIEWIDPEEYCKEFNGKQ